MENVMVSVIITTYNTSESLQRAIESVKKQTYPSIEIIVVDDNNPNTQGRVNAEKIMEKYSDSNYITYIQHKENKNGSAARNTGIRCATGKYISFLDDDDVYLPDRIEKCVETITCNPEYVAVYTAVKLICENEREIIHEVKLSGYIWKDLLLDESLLATGSNLFLLREAVNEVNGFDESFQRYQDIEFMLRVLQKHQIYALNEVLVEKYVGTRNVPAYKIYRNIRLKIFSTFSYLIDQLSITERRIFYIKNYKALFSLALASENKQDIKQAANELKRYRKLTLKERGVVCFPIVLKIWKLLRR